MASDLTDEQLRAIYAWIDAIPLSRPKKNIARDFSDGVMLAEVIAAYFPNLVEVHNYPAANNARQKIYNFETLNKRVLKKLGYTIPRDTIEDIVNAKVGAVEKVLNSVQIKMAKYRERKSSAEDESPPQRESVAPSANRPMPSGKSDYDNGAREVSKAGKASPQQNQGLQRRKKNNDIGASVDEEILFEKEQQIRELHETVEILELKIAKLEQLVRLKDNKIQKLLNKA
ncbi:hypothetical protein B484DRAFT_446386 [Ochromonadaceae sp. CCMP2298]|nr:hypothetical protein B484DRAFT_446386 [Ochromonadaceae sp. CCMP2298]|mmetsp:Transcript_11247/g.25009  ORF Transcript_11247/g.25009 Transcript_11247/m.25009 type:complete len:229 (-) Transcript_11247:72-758(-)|eukprot:CAMPEP_0173255210 /NCGR_PEP_ID=MMETSP1142-20121109/22390_1 /TAXON_ID=483371 /ORGANISM="non described non described, Strain CCMP2298" /LENGTH=228 /DNA_ID=CAMNT_0014188807 /DNA_START=66 /DNA_END=752 /DNA_ORIENTATION=-